LGSGSGNCGTSGVRDECFLDEFLELFEFTDYDSLVFAFKETLLREVEGRSIGYGVKCLGC
jgi:hypothetical protein